jgi:cytochrome c553
MTNKIFYLVCIGILISFQYVRAEGNSEAGAQKALACAGCHGQNGNSVNPLWPKLAAQHPQYTVKQLQDFKSGNRSNPQMSPMATALSEQDMEDIAAYYAEQSITEGQIPASVEDRLIELGERIYRAGDINKGLASCMACHGPAGTGNPTAGFPNVASQHSAYTAVQLQAFKTEARNNDTNSVMQDVSLKLTNDEINAVSLYLQGLN